MKQIGDYKNVRQGQAHL